MNDDMIFNNEPIHAPENGAGTPAPEAPAENGTAYSAPQAPAAGGNPYIQGGNPYMQNGNPYLQGNPYTQAGAPCPQGGSPAVRPVPPIKAARPRFDVQKEDLIFAGIAAAFTLFGVAAGLWGGARLGFAAAFLICFVAMSVYLGRKKCRPTGFGVLCGVLAVAMTPTFVLTSNGIVRTLSAVGAAGLSVLWFASLAGRKIPAGDLGLAAAAGLPLLEVPENLGRTLRGVFSGSTRMKRFSKVLLGLLCAVPVLCAVIPLLMHSDAAFEGMLQSVFADLGTAAVQLIVTVLLLPLILSFAFSLRKSEKETPVLKEGKGLDTGFLTAFFAALAVVYLVYLFSQLAYFFNAFKGLLPEGYDFSYAEYARRGFFELCAVAGINLILIFAAVLFSRKKEGRLPVTVKAAGTFISLFTLVLIGTALAKMFMYIQNFGMTVLRLGTSAFMVFMAVVFLAVLLRLYSAKVRVLHVAAVTAALVLVVLGIGNINGFVAKYNYDAYTAGKLAVIDVNYLYELGPEGWPYLVKLASDETQPDGIRRGAAVRLEYACTQLFENEWKIDKYEYKNEYSFDGYTFTNPLKRTAARPSQYSLPQQKAYEAIDAFLAEYPDFLEVEDYRRSLYYDYWGYFDPADAEPPKPDDSKYWDWMDEMEENTTASDLTNSAFSRFDEYKNDFNACAVFLEGLVKDGTAAEGDRFEYYGDTVKVVCRGTHTKLDVTDIADTAVMESFNRLHNDLPTVDTVLVYKDSLRFVQPEAHDIYDRLAYTFNGSTPDLSPETSGAFFQYYPYRSQRLSDNWFLLTPNN